MITGPIVRNMAVVIDGLEFRDPAKITAVVTKDRESDQPDYGEATVYNLSPGTRQAVINAERIEIFFGYQGTVELVYAGDIQAVEHKKTETEWQTKFIAGDGAVALQQAIINKTYSEPMTPKELIEDMARSSGLTQTVKFNGIDKENAKRELRGSTRVGQAQNEIKMLCNQFGWTWNMQNGILYVTGREGSKEGTAFLINSETGMIGSPEWVNTGRNQKGGKPENGLKIRVKTLPIPSIEPSDKIRVQTTGLQAQVGGLSIGVDGGTVDEEFVVEKVNHRLDSREGMAYTEIEAVLVGGGGENEPE